MQKNDKGGFRRVGPTDESYKLFFKNDDVVAICKTKLASVFCEAQHLKFIGHVARRDNNVPQKQWLFSKTHKGQTDQWLLLGWDWNMEASKIR